MSTTPFTERTEPEVFVDEQRRRSGVPGLAVAVVSAGQVVWSHASGLADLATSRPFSTATVCHWFSMTKIVAVTAAMQLVDRGALALDTPVVGVAPGLLPPAFAAVTVRHLAEHSAGFTNPLPLRWVHPAGEPAPDQRAFVGALPAHQRRPRYVPGTTARYSNVSTMVLGEVIAAVAGQPFVDYVTEHVLAPLGLTDTAFAYTPTMLERAAVGYATVPPLVSSVLRRYLPDGVVGDRHGRRVAFRPFEMDASACSGLLGTVTDAARFAAVHINGGTVDGVTLLRPETTTCMQAITRTGKPYDMGLGWFRPRHDRAATLPYVEHLGGGGGFFNAMRLYPTLDVAVVVMANTTRHYDVAAIADHLARRTWS